MYNYPNLHYCRSTKFQLQSLKQMSGKETDFELEPAGSEQAGKRTKTENTSSVECRDVDRGYSCVDLDEECMSESEIIGASRDLSVTIVDTSRSCVVTVKSMSEVLESLEKADADYVSGEIKSSAGDQSSCIVFEQMHSHETPSTNDPSDRISEQKPDTMMNDENDAQAAGPNHQMDKEK